MKTRTIALATSAALASTLLATCTGETAASADAPVVPLSVSSAPNPGVAALRPLDFSTREAAGQYVYTCFSGDGNSYTMKAGVTLSTCKGASITQHIGGRYVLTINLTQSGKPSNFAKQSIWCYVALGGVGWSVLTLSGGVGIVSLGFSLTGISACTA
ncbi:MAG: hypothetical protein JWR01_95 [Subtercola sp.]|jgi:hypothetical protein|nr:hypothetical protein [Subtercola sp.]